VSKPSSRGGEVNRVGSSVIGSDCVVSANSFPRGFDIFAGICDGLELADEEGASRRRLGCRAGAAMLFFEEPASLLDRP
jgi:hypothetical protein